MGLAIALHLLVFLTSTTLSTSTTMTDDTDDHPPSYRTVPLFTLKNPMWFRKFVTHCKENKLGWLMNASQGDDPSYISNFDDLTSEAYSETEGDEKTRFYNDSLIIAGKLESATYGVPVARSIVARALQPNGAPSLCHVEKYSVALEFCHISAVHAHVL